ncbi:MAG: hypothetical protein ACSLE9_03890 [Burkholderiaceae bacterium]
MRRWALQASLVIVLESQRGAWCTLAWLAGRVVAPMHVIEPLLVDLVDARLAQSGTLGDGRAAYGVDVVLEYPAVRDVAAAMPAGAWLGPGRAQWT